MKQGDYSSRLEEVLSDDQHSDSDEFHYEGGDDDEEEEGFVYSGNDADDGAPQTSYEEQLRDVLDGDLDSDDEISPNAFATGDHSFASVTHHPDVSIEVSSPQVCYLINVICKTNLTCSQA